MIPDNYYEKWSIFNLPQWWWHRRKVAVVREIMEQCLPFYKVLDVGCNGGTRTAKLARCFPAAKFTGVDISSSAIRFACQKHSGLTFLQADAHKLPFSDQNFDLIFSLETLEHLKKPGKALEEFKRCLEKNGSIIIELDSGSILFRLIWFFWVRTLGKVWKDAHLWRFNAKKLEDLFGKHGFRVVSQKFFNLRMGVVFRLKRA